jgi:bifunctional non-homologous end joining protein LigD
VKSGLDPKRLHPPRRRALLKKPDPWKDFRDGAVNLRPVLKKMGV